MTVALLADQVEEFQSANTRARICIVTSAPVCCNPRVVKEADALSAAGYDVRVVASQHVRWAAQWDDELMEHRDWKLDAIRWFDSQNGNLRTRSAVRQRAFGAATNFTEKLLIPERAYSRLFPEQLQRATQQCADLFIAHNPQALPVAAEAAKHFGVPFAFDAEDFHSGEFTPAERNSKQFRLLTHLESKYLPKCAYVTSPSEEICEALTDRYRIKKPTTIHNVFSWSERQTLDGAVKDRRGPALSLYWYSQIVGLDRGLQDVIQAIALLNGPVQLHIRGDVTDSVRQELMRLAKAHDVAGSIYFHAPVRPDELLSRAAEHDVGLALEQLVTENRNLTATNKIFHYLLAGLSVAATQTKGQLGVMAQSHRAGFLYEPGDYRTLADNLEQLFDSPDLLEQRKISALEVARLHWNWESESRTLLKLVREVLDR